MAQPPRTPPPADTEPATLPQQLLRWCALVRSGLDRDLLARLVNQSRLQHAQSDIELAIKTLIKNGQLKPYFGTRMLQIPGGLLERHALLGNPLPGALESTIGKLVQLVMSYRTSQLIDEYDGKVWAYWSGDPRKLSEALLDDSMDSNLHPVRLLASTLTEAQFRQTAPAFQAVLASRAIWMDFQQPQAADLDRVEVWYQRLLHLLDSGFPPDDVEMGLALMALWRGDQAVLQRLETAPLRLGQLYGALLSGDFARAATGYDDYLQQVRKGLGRRKFTFPATDGYLHILLLLGRGDQKSLQKAQELCGMMDPNTVHLDCLTDLVQHQLGTLDARRRLDLRLDADAVTLCWQLLARYWLDLDPTQLQSAGNRQVVKAAAAFLHRCKLHWLLAQLQDVARPLGLPDGTPNAPSFPLLRHLLTKQEPWQRALDALSRLGEAGPAAETETRLVWWLTVDRTTMALEPREQKRTGKGWSKGRRLPAESVRQGKRPACASDQDMIALNSLDYENASYATWHPDFALALPHLIGHPAVYWADAVESRVELVAGEVVMQLRKTGDKLLLVLDPPILFDAKVVWRRETPTRLVVCRVNATHRQIADIVRSGLTLPAGSEDRAIAALTQVAPHIAVHSEIGSLGQNIPEVAANPQLFLHLLPSGEGLTVQALVQPLAAGRWHEPGAGAAVVLGEQAGKPVQTRRDLAAERAALAQLIEHCPALQQPLEDQQWRLPTALDSLELLEQLGAVGDQVQLVWPEGVRFKVRSLQPGQFNVKVTSQQDWFALSGGVKIDEQRVLGIQELLQLARESGGRFLALGDGEYLALTDAFRRRVAALGNLADISKKDAKISRLASSVLDEALADFGDVELDQAWHAHQARLASARSYQPELPSTLQADLRDYQLQGFEWLARLAHWGVGACLADDMGLGKTLQALALLVMRAPAGPALVIAPTSVANNWLSEAARFAPTLKVHNYADVRADIRSAGPFDLVVASYGLLQQDLAHFTANPWHTLILDEAQAIKNAQTKRAQAAMALTADFRCALSGTPVENHLGELWSLYRFLNPGLFGSEARFNERFATPISRGDTAARDLLRQLLRPFVLRRTKSQVLSELPPRTEITLPVALSAEEMALYEATRRQSLDKLSQSGEGPKLLQMLAEIMRLRRLCCHPRLVDPASTLPGSKLAAFAELAQHIIDNKHKALVFSQFVDHLSIVRQWLDEAGIQYQYLDGSTPAADRKKRVDAFQAGAGDMFLISLKAGGVGLNLTAADYVIHLDPWWNPAVEDQASDRAHRIGQQRPVTIYRLVAQHTIEEKIVALHASKRQLADSLLDGGDASAKLNEDALLQLLRESAGGAA